ncbi:PASTA domain-containing protein [Nonomuraea sp. NPDC049649]|uniref:serine/threonine-protein kinase n=1 Tax=Nonomuraea sp. NPDC049649 TaxID=3155776 RepID=UPI003434DC45
MPTARPLRTGDPRTLGPYELSGRLGDGGQGVVYLGALAGESYAVKLLHGPVGDGRGAFLREVELAKHVARFCTAQVVDAGFDEGRPYIVSEYVDGPSLAREVMLAGPRRGGALERLAVGTATAIAAIHRAGIVHRDLKPQNVLLGPDGPRVIDFGLARALDASATLTNRGVGTPAYMAPEQITASAVTGAVDVFAWGGTICFAANGTAPFGQDSVAPVLHRILTAPPDLGSLEGRLRELVAACLDKEARNRPTSRELLLELLGTSDGVPAEVLRSPPPHIVRAVSPPRGPSADADPAPVAEPESTGALGAYHLMDSRDGMDSPPSGSHPAARNAPLPPSSSGVSEGSLSPGSGSGRSSEKAARVRGAVFRGSPAGYPVERVARRDAGGTDRPGGSVSSASGPGESAPPGKAGRSGRSLGAAGLAVVGALLVTGAVLVTMFVPLFREDGMRVRAGTPTSGPVVVPPASETEDTPKERPPTRVRREDSSLPVSGKPSVRQPVKIAVPEVVGLSRSAAVKALERAGLKVGDVSKTDSRRKIGQVLASRPAAGARVAAGAAVALEVSAGVRVPAVAGMRREEAEKAVTGAGLKVGKVSTTCGRKPEGEVLSSTPEAGARVSGGAAVSLVVARRGAPVPGVTGQSRDKALAALRAAGFTPAIRTRVVEEESRWDVVIAQYPAADTCTRPGRRVLVTVGAQPPGGPDPTEPTPSATGEPTTEP